MNDLRLAVRLTLACLVVLTTGCGRERRCAVQAPSRGGDALRAAREGAETPAERQFRFRADEFEREMDRRASRRAGSRGEGAAVGAAPFRVLVLSGGGSNGAWGAGFLHGWGGTGRRPVFDVVTGVSTGALIATAALLGEDELLRKSYTTTRTSDVQRGRFFLSIPFSSSLYDTAPLKRMIDRELSKEIIDRVAHQATHHNRKLYVGTVNLDSGRLVIWDLTRIAAAGNYDLYRKAVYASASVPVLYTPVEIDSALHVDGGVRALLFFRTYLLPKIAAGSRAARAAAAARAPATAPAAPDTAPATAPDAAPAAPPAPAPDAPRPAVYVIVNGKIGVDPRCVNDGLLPIALRSIECLVDANGVASVYETKLFARELGYDFFLSYIPDGVPSLPSDQFVPEKMTRLFDQGARRGRDGEFFDIPSLDELRERRGL